MPTDAPCDEAVAEWDQCYAFVAKNRKTRRLMREKFKSAATADEFDAFGMRCDTPKRFHDSARFFGFATELDSTHALAHYNLACAYARGRRALRRMSRTQKSPRHGGEGSGCPTDRGLRSCSRP